MKVPGLGHRNPPSPAGATPAAFAGAVETTIGDVDTAGLGLRDAAGGGADFAGGAGGVGAAQAICGVAAARSGMGGLPEPAGSPMMTSACFLLSMVHAGHLERKL